MAIDFPNSPTTNQIFTSGGKTWVYDGTVWTLRSSLAGPGGITSTELANSSVTSDKIASGAIVSNLGFTPASTGKSIAMAIVFGG